MKPDYRRVWKASVVPEPPVCQIPTQATEEISEFVSSSESFLMRKSILMANVVDKESTLRYGKVI